MSKEMNKDALDRAREEALQRHIDGRMPVVKRKPEGLLPHIVAWKDTAVQTTKKYFHWIVPATKPIRWVAPKLGHGLAWHWKSIAYSTDKNDVKHFSPKRLAAGLLVDTAIILATPFIIAGTYYHATLRTYEDVFVPNAGVFVNQQFEKANEPGRIIAPRDEIFTVLGQHADEAGKVESIRFDIDSNSYFFYKANALRPDLQAAKLVPISPYGAMCNVEATGLYTRLPRFIRLSAMKWLDLRPEIVNVKGDCIQLESVPPQYKQGNAPTTLEHFKQLHAPETQPAPAPTAPAAPASNSPASTPKASEAVPH